MESAPLIYAGITGSGQIIDLISTIQAGRTQSRNLRFNARVAEQNAEAARRDAATARIDTLRHIEELELRGKIRRGNITANAAASGVQADTGSPLEVLAADAYQTGRQIAIDQQKGMMAVQDLEVEAAQQEFVSKYMRKLAGRARSDALLNAFSSFGLQTANNLPIYTKGFNTARSLLTPTPRSRGIGARFSGPQIFNADF